MGSANYIEQLHNVELQILDEIDRICSENDIRYSITAGTLLGAVRHGGFIPWDDDADIVMPREDYEKFCKIANEKMNPEFFVDSFYTSKRHFFKFAKVRKKNTIFQEAYLANTKKKVNNEIYIDVFPLDNADSSLELMKRKQRTINLLAGLLELKFVNLKTGKKYSLMSKCIPVCVLRKAITAIMKSGPSNSCNYVNYGSQYGVEKQTMPKEVYFPSTKIQFEDRIYRAPANQIYFLKKLYGEKYMELPPEEKRRTHVPSDICFDVAERERKAQNV